MRRPTMVTICDRSRVLIELSELDSEGRYTEMGFKRLPDYERLYRFGSQHPHDVYTMCEKMRDLGVPFATHRMGGADEVVELFRQGGHVRGNFKRIDFFGNDRDENAMFLIEEF